jgi:hypothetical protein
MMNIEQGMSKDEGRKRSETSFLLRPSKFLVQYSTINDSEFDLRPDETRIELHP